MPDRCPACGSCDAPFYDFCQPNTRALGLELLSILEDHSLLAEHPVDDHWTDSMVRAYLLDSYSSGRSKFHLANRSNDIRVLEEALDSLISQRNSTLRLTAQSSVLLQKSNSMVKLSTFDVIAELEARYRAILDKLTIEAVDLKVDWEACALASTAEKIWKQRTGKEAPKTLHADALGPFGRFLQDVCDAVSARYRPESKPISARSALRALRHVTKSGTFDRRNW